MPLVRWPRSTNPSTLRLYSFTPRPPIPPLYCHIRSLHCKIPSLDDPDSFTSLQHSFTRRPSFLHSTAKFLHSTIPRVTVISVPCLRRKSQLPSDGHSSDPLRALACVMYVFRWEMLAALIGMGIINLHTPTYTKPPESPSNDTKS